MSETPSSDESVAGELGSRAFAAGVAGCSAAVAAFLAVQLPGWPPHEDETLALLVGRRPLGETLHIVLDSRGGATLHFLLAWTVAHAGGGLYAMRFLSALFAVLSLVAIAALGARLAGRNRALAATVLTAGSWLLLFHGVDASAYSLFLLLATVSYLALMRALERGSRSGWAAWAAAIVLTIAAHPYGALVLGSQGLHVLLRREQLREAAVAFGAVLVLAVPFWRASLALTSSFDLGLAGRGAELDTPGAVFGHLWHVAGDASAGYKGVLVVVLLFAAFGLWRMLRQRPPAGLMPICVVATPTLFLLVGLFGGSTAPESRYLIFALPFLALAAAAGILSASAAAGRPGPWLAALVVAALLPAEIAWAWQRTPALFEREIPVRVEARAHAAAWLAATSRPDDILFAYEPLYLAAWERDRSAFPLTVIPRADPTLMLRALDEARKPLGRAVFIFDAGDDDNVVKATEIELRLPVPHHAFEGRTYGPYLVIRTVAPVVTIDRFLGDAGKVELIGKSLRMGDADLNYATVRQARARLAAVRSHRRTAPARASPRSTALARRRPARRESVCAGGGGG